MIIYNEIQFFIEQKKKRFIIPLERAIVRASKAVDKSERVMKNIRRNFANVVTSKEENLHSQKNSTWKQNHWIISKSLWAVDNYLEYCELKKKSQNSTDFSSS
jgi:hypothetical protein